MRIKSFVVGLIGTNCFLVWDEASKDAMLVDPGDYDPAVSREIKDSGLRLKYIALTHGHGDHIGGVPGYRNGFPEALLVCGKEDLELIGDTSANTSGMFFGKRLVLDVDLTPGEGDELALGALSFRVIETPGHTKGGLSYYGAGCDECYADGDAGKKYSGIVFSGDTLFCQSIGRTDLYGGDFQVLIASIQGKLFGLPGDTLVLPGHMDSTTIDREKKNNPFAGL